MQSARSVVIVNWRGSTSSGDPCHQREGVRPTSCCVRVATLAIEKTQAGHELVDDLLRLEEAPTLGVYRSPRAWSA
jgi:hypothetical protein